MTDEQSTQITIDFLTSGKIVLEFDTNICAIEWFVVKGLFDVGSFST